MIGSICDCVKLQPSEYNFLILFKGLVIYILIRIVAISIFNNNDNRR
jgi:hypothetical protein